MISTLSYAVDNKHNSNDKFLEYDYFNHNYLYLDKDYKINISKKTFNNQLKELNISSCRINNYYDSLIVIMSLEFEEKSFARCAAYRMGYTWTRLGYHLWLSADDAKKLADEFGYSHPYIFKKYLLQSQDPKVNAIYHDLNVKIAAEYPEKEFNNLSKSKFLDQSLRLNPTRIKDSEKLKKEVVKKRNGESCSKENCCQTK